MEYSCDVSVICIVYNHAKYLRKCLDSIVMQNGVKYEVIVHDDASTDGSSDIIKEYEKRYPEIIKPIYQTENQYSQGKSPSEICSKQLTGKYTAFCEGDDYWTDPYKLKKQFEALEMNAGCYLCTHKVRVISNEEITNDFFPCEKYHTGILLGSDLLGSTAHLFQASSYFLRTKNYLDIYNFDFKKISRVGDVPMLLYCESLGDVYYINNEMSHYRRAIDGSWTQRIYENPDKICDHYRNMIAVLKSFQVYSKGKFSRQVFVRILSNKHLLFEANKDKRELFDKDYFLCLKAYSIQKRIIVLLFDFFPSFKKWYMKAENKA